MLDYRVHLDADGLYNTPPTFAVYVMDRVLAWIARQGGVAAMGRQNGLKAAAVYELIDAGTFYRGTADVASRSRMNVTFRLPTEDLERRFLGEAREAGFVGLQGHRSVGGIRASLYNALPPESVRALVSFMEAFAKRHGN
jgi:phosphoserine aminotransferase